MSESNYDELEKLLMNFLSRRLAKRKQTCFNSFRVSRRLQIQGQVLRQILGRLEAKGKVKHIDKTLWIFYRDPQPNPEINHDDAYRFRTALQMVQREQKEAKK